MRRSCTIIALISALFSSASTAEYNIDTSKDNLVRFISDAPLEDFDGVTDQIDGYVFWEGDVLPEDMSGLESSELYFEVKLATLDTGIGLRNRHMRDNYLETDKYPYASFKARLNEIRQLSDTLYSAIAAGQMSIHGNENPLRVTTTIIPHDKGFRIKCNFEVNLDDFDIEVPKFMFLKISEIIRLELDFYLSLRTDGK
jgi:polyisoprenoid-binding protein YceI